MSIKELYKEYNKQTYNVFSSNMPYLGSKDAYGTGVGNSNEAQLFYNTGGLFADCDLEASVINAVIQPAVTLANMIPVMGDNRDIMKWAFITQIDDGDDVLPEDVCDFGPTPGDIAKCTMTCEPGRYSVSTKTIELDAIIRKAHRGVQEDLYLVGSVRGVSAIAGKAQLEDNRFLERAAIRRQMSLAGRKLQRVLGKAFWVGDPADPTQNTVGGGRKAFMGLDLLIADDYGSKPGVTGTNCASLNSDIKNFPFCVNGVDANNRNIYDYLKALEFTIHNRASGMGLLPFTAAFVMRSEMWYALVQSLPCQMMGSGCQGVKAGGVTVAANDGIVEVMRQRLLDSKTLILNGHTYAVIEDDFIPVTETVVKTGVEYASDIYFVPLTVAGESVLYWSLIDYSLLGTQLSALPTGNILSSAGWSDGGRFHNSIGLGSTGRCFRIDSKIEPCLVMKAPFLAGKISGIKSCNLQSSSVFNPDSITG